MFWCSLTKLWLYPHPSLEQHIGRTAAVCQVQAAQVAAWEKIFPKIYLFILKLGFVVRERQKEREVSSVPWFTPQMATIARMTCSEARNFSQISQGLETSCTTFSGTLAGNWVRIGVVRTGTGASPTGNTFTCLYNVSPSLFFFCYFLALWFW